MTKIYKRVGYPKYPKIILTTRLKSDDKNSSIDSTWIFLKKIGTMNGLMRPIKGVSMDFKKSTKLYNFKFASLIIGSRTIIMRKHSKQ